ncbi:MAG: D-glycero-beta-D-manno-heptose 1-phosphate adenylyltransferase [Oligoflexia bacterium]|nr:D-glycero-beta-D-manno-heptose 1-phosphate adenylyltransferase [Oligoflexia bacterium]
MKTSANKILSRDSAQQLRESWRRQGKRVVFTSGVFDLLHRGHAEYLEQARALGDVLIVALNSDVSVRKNKGEDRPIVPELDRARLVAALESVDAVFIFDEQNNNTNIELLKPDIYVKAGDYSRDKLSSAAIVESYGGKVELVQFVKGSSSSAIIDKILQTYLNQVSVPMPSAPYELAPAIFVDRDGTLIESVEYLGDPAQCRLLPGAVGALRVLGDMGFRIVMVTNQPGVGLGYFTMEDLYRVNRVILKAAGKVGAKFHKVYICPHSHADECPCRKPKAAMIDRAVKELNIDLKRSFVIGDTTLDLMMAKNAGVKSILVATGQAGLDGICQVTPDYSVADLPAAAALIAELVRGS